MKEAKIVEDIVIVGGGIAGLTTAVGLHRLGFKSLVLESSDSLRVTGFALTVWRNAWKALDAVGVGDTLRQEHVQLHGNITTSLITGERTSSTSFKYIGKHGAGEVRRVRRQRMLEVLADELPSDTIRFSSKVATIEESGFSKIVHLVDGTTIKAKVLIGGDGVNSVVARWLGFKQPSYTGRCAARGTAEFKSSHGFDHKFMQFFGLGCRYGAIPCDDNTVSWFFTWVPTDQDKDLGENPAKLKQFVLKKLENAPSDIQSIIENTELSSFLTSPLRYRQPWELLFGNISKGNVCVAGDALHPMTPDLGQGGCSALEDGVILARCLGEAFSKEKDEEKDEGEQYKRIKEALKKYAKERRWRSIDLISTGYVVGYIQEGESKFTTFLRDSVLAPFLSSQFVKKSEFDCGKLDNSL